MKQTIGNQSSNCSVAFFYQPHILFFVAFRSLAFAFEYVIGVWNIPIFALLHVEQWNAIDLQSSKLRKYRIEKLAGRTSVIDSSVLCDFAIGVCFVQKTEVLVNRH